MITRRYFYHGFIYKDGATFFYGVVTHKSWFPDPSLCLLDTINKNMKEYGVDKSQVNIDAFNKV